MQFQFIKHRKIYYFLSGMLALVSIAGLIIFNLNLDVDLTGGSILEVEYKGNFPEESEIREKLAEKNLGRLEIQIIKAGVLELKMGPIDEPTHQEIISKIGEGYELQELRFELIGSVIGKELREKTEFLVIVSLSAIVFYIGYSFRKVSRPIKSWQYGLISLVALFYNVLIPLGLFSFLGKFYGVEITTPIIIGLLTVIGYSINDTIVVFDRIRENLLKSRWASFDETVNASLNQIFIRSISTGSCTLMVLGALFLFGDETLKYFALSLIVGIAVGTYSSMFLAAPLLTSWLGWRRR